jgi:uncharacterized protein (TIGR00288 family)
MNMSFARAPHQGVGAPPGSGAHAALLIDFDNVTMGMRSDLSKDLKKLLQSDIIKGKVTVQRAYADWRRYPQYIVPLSEASIDLIFAPAYGSNKKNATDIRMAIDGMELVFTRPEIGTFILLTGDSDFSSLVLKLKEYGKYVIGVGIQESSSDILVQNCDEYYSYTSLTGLRKTADSERAAVDPWILVEKAINRMAERDDVMRSDRLKQVMIEIDPNFDEGDFGYSKFSRFLSEAAAKGLVRLTKLENGQHEVGPAGGGRADGRRRPEEGRGGRGERERGERGRRGRERQGRPERGERAERPAGPERAEPAEVPDANRVEEQGREVAAATARATAAAEPPREAEGRPLAAAYDLVRRALESLRDMGRESVRDSDLKRKMLELDGSFDETSLGFGKFSRFLRQAHDHEVVNLQKQEGGNYEVSLGGAQPAGAPAPSETSPAGAERTEPAGERAVAAQEPAAPTARAERQEAARTPAAPSGLGPRRGSGRRTQAAPPPLLDGQVLPRRGEEDAVGRAAAGVAAPAGAVDPASLGLPTESDAQVRYLTSYRGVGRKTAEALVERFGPNLFEVLHSEPERLEAVVPSGRAEQVLRAWRDDYERRTGSLAAAAEPTALQGATAEGVTTSEGDAAQQGPAETPNGSPEGRRQGGSGRRRSRRGGRRGGRDQGS